ncbi:uncharacterized protein F5Z01DRAFT_272602 [Emericellopsis atlantica]|uniref:Uncharacterized protein n=1 Tax=Emericellopsis atlantica TaxID=2614577 RepID=A0A9P8CLG5_9HYPO|nr:uncharacterized protein F5Z01DRAFT_272602 [Emericellopsis atlantica]KAG9251609.1 hypothetical protein F5Z01DRAFT_272602 [Emericellopsis atlantica]
MIITMEAPSTYRPEGHHTSVPMTPPPEKADCDRQQQPLTIVPPPQPQSLEPPTPDSLPKDFPSGHCSTSSESISSSSRRQRNRPRRQSTPAYELACSPRDPLSLHTERAYLHQELMRRAAWSQKLYRDHCLANETFRAATNAKEQRRWKKKLSLLREKINEAACQERVIYQRLGDLSFALSSQDRWTHAQRATTLTYSPTTLPQMDYPTDCKEPSTPRILNATSPTFVPRSLSLNSCLEPERGLDPVGEEDEGHADVVEDHSSSEAGHMEASPRERRRSVSSPRERRRSVSSPRERRRSVSSPVCSPLEKRLSMPDLPALWS